MNKLSKKVAGGAFLIQDTKQAFFPEDLTEEHRMIEKTAHEFMTKEVIPQLNLIENQEFDVVVSILKKAGEVGLLAHSIPEEYGGLGLDKVSKAVVGEALGRGGAYSVAHSNHTCIATLPITYYGTKAQKEKYLPKLASGEYLGAYCLTEPEAGSDAMAAKTTAVLNENKTHYLLNGTKIFITNASFSDTFIVYAKVDGEHFTAFIVEKDFPGLSLGPEEKKMGIKGSSTRSVILENCEVPVENVLGEIGRGHIIAFTVLNLGRFNLGFATNGGAKEALKTIVQHILERKQFGQSIANFGATKEKVTKLVARIFTTESLLYRTAFLVEERLAGLDMEEDLQKIVKGLSEYALESAICKVHGSETLDFAVDEGVQLHGGSGFIQEYRIEQMYRDSRINRIFEGTNEVNRLLITNQFLKKAQKGELFFEKGLEEAYLQLNKSEEFTKEMLVKDIRATFLVLVERALQKYGKNLNFEQEVTMKLSNIAIQLYAAESVILRLKKKEEKTESTFMSLIVETALEEIVHDMFMEVKRLENDLFELDDMLREKIYKRLLGYRFNDSIERNRQIAAVIYEKGEYVC